MEAELSDEQTGLVAAFSELTGADSETASHVLEAHGWDLNAGVDFFLENGARPAAVPPAAPLDPEEGFEDPDEPIVIDSEEERDAALARRLAEEPDGLGVQGMGMGMGMGMDRGFQPAEGGGFPGFPQMEETGPSPAMMGAGGPSARGDDDDPELPDGINAEEARMLEAAMFGTAYQGRIPDFSNPPPPENLDPALVQQRMLRDEQDAAFQASLRADQKRQEAMEAARLAEQEAQREAREQEVFERRRKEEEKRATARLLDEKRGRLGAESASGEEGAVQVQVRLPDGSRLTRIFKTSDPMPRLFDFVDVAIADAGGGEEMGSYTLGTQFPRRVFEADQEGTLESNGLNHKQEALFMQKK